MSGTGLLHLTEEQFADAVLGEPLAADVARHVEACAACRAELDGFGAAVGEFRQLSRTWSERRSEQMPAIRPEAAPGKGEAGRYAPAYAWVAAGLLAVGITVPVVDHLWHGTAAPAAQVAQVADDSAMNSPEQIARDNQLLAEVHFELTRTDLATQPRERKGQP